MGVTAEQLAISAATIADDGVNPLTKKRVFGAELTPKVVALMSAVGFYEHSGDWLYATGLPAKTGVGGAVIGVMPGLFGVCAFAPPLDDAGNSVKAQAALKHLMKNLNLNVFSNTHYYVISNCNIFCDDCLINCYILSDKGLFHNDRVTHYTAFFNHYTRSDNRVINFTVNFTAFADDTSFYNSFC